MASAQQQPLRILFLIDASGSMNQKMGTDTRWKLASSLLYQIADSLEKQKADIQIAVRVFGHQSPNSAKNCEDSKLEIPFSNSSASLIQQKLNKIKPKGYTPIAYSIEQAAINDFPADKRNVLNAIVLITDGIETCGGDPCAATQALEAKHISLKPFIIGLGIEDSLIKKFNCVGTYYDVRNAAGFKNALQSIVGQISQKTSLQINLLDQKGWASETNQEITLADSYSGALRYAFIHATNEAGISDTVKVDPVGLYDITVHTYPPITKKKISIVPGRHNTLAFDVPQGNLQLQISGANVNTNRSSDVQAVIHPAGSDEIVYVQDLNSSIRYLAGEYDIEILSTPRINLRGVLVIPNETKTLNIPAAGTVTLSLLSGGWCSIYTTNSLARWEKIYDAGNAKPGTYTINLQPGEYDIVYKSNNRIGSEQTLTKHIVVESSKTIMVRL
jgi:Ca-activated chloride channel family protein